MNNLAKQQTTALSTELVDRARSYAQASKAPATRRAYRRAWTAFEGWCASQGGRQALPASPETVALYLAARAEDHRPATLAMDKVAISQAHQAAGAPNPVPSAAVRAVWQGIRRQLGAAQRTVAPVTTPDLRAMLPMGSGLRDTRDRALLLVGFAGAFRRSELVALDVADLEITPEGLTVTLRRSKTDQEGQGRQVGIPYGRHPETCPVAAVQAWLAAAGIEEGPVFRPVNRHGQVGAAGGGASERLSAHAVALVVKQRAQAAGLDPSRFSGHSLRAGLATAAAMAGASERAIMRQTGHRSVTMVRRYIRTGSLYRENAAAAVGL